MAIIRSLINDTSKSIRSRGETAADYNFDDEYFSVWSYKNGDMKREGDCPQNIQFDKEMAKALRDGLNAFLLDT